jgi:hypothetical protein
MKENKSDIVRIRDDGTAGRDAAPGDCTLQTAPAVKDPALYGGDKPIRMTFPLCFEDIWFGYILFPLIVLIFTVFQFAAWKSIIKWLFFGEPLDRNGLLVNLLMCVLFGAGVVWIVYSWFVDYYRKRARSITVDPATKTFRVRNFVLTRGKHLLPWFYPELTFTLDDVRKVYYRRAVNSSVLIDSGIYIVIPEGYFFVYAGEGYSSALGTTGEFRRMKYFLLIEAEGKNESTLYCTLDGVCRRWERF